MPALRVAILGCFAITLSRCKQAASRDVPQNDSNHKIAPPQPQQRKALVFTLPFCLGDMNSLCAPLTMIHRPALQRSSRDVFPSNLFAFMQFRTLSHATEGVARACCPQTLALRLAFLNSLECAFTRSDLRNSFGICIYENCRGGGGSFPFRNDMVSRRRTVSFHCDECAETLRFSTSHQSRITSHYLSSYCTLSCEVTQSHRYQDRELAPSTGKQSRFLRCLTKGADSGSGKGSRRDLARRSILGRDVGRPEFRADRMTRSFGAGFVEAGLWPGSFKAN